MDVLCNYRGGWWSGIKTFVRDVGVTLFVPAGTWESIADREDVFCAELERCQRERDTLRKSIFPSDTTIEKHQRHLADRDARIERLEREQAHLALCTYTFIGHLLAKYPEIKQMVEEVLAQPVEEQR
jgi:hypothetical protein